MCSRRCGRHNILQCTDIRFKTLEGSSDNMGRKDTLEVMLPKEDRRSRGEEANEPYDQYEEYEEYDNGSSVYLDDSYSGYTVKDGAERKENCVSKPPRKRKKRKKKRYFLKFLILCALVATAMAFLSSDFFLVKNIKVEGNINYTEEEIVKKAGDKTGKNIFKIDKGRMVENLKKDSYVDSVKISRSLPRTIVIKIKERKEIAAIPYGKGFVVIDNAGYVLNKVSTVPKLTILDGTTIKSVKKGQVIRVKEKDVLSKTLALLKAMEYSDLFFKKIDVSTVVVKVYIYDTLVCKGTPDNILRNLKNGNLERIMYDLYQKGITTGTINVGADQYCAFSPNID